MNRSDGTRRGTCQRCERSELILRQFAGQDLCATCYRAAFKTVDLCHSCGERRLVPARHGNHPVCAPCAGLTKFGCLTCSDVSSPMQNCTQCERCRIRARFVDRPEPAATIDKLVELLVGKHPKTITRWTASGPRLTGFLQRITDGHPASAADLVDPAARRYGHH